MSLVATKIEKAPILEAGVYTAVCTAVIDLGIQYNKVFDKSSQQVKVIWNVVGETVEINGEILPRHIGKDFTLSLDEKSNLRKMLTSWRGRPFTAEELAGFDLKNILGASCQLQIIHKDGSNGTYALVNSIMSLSKGTPKPEAEETLYFDMDDQSTYEMFEFLPKYVQKRISEAENFAATGLPEPENNPGGNGNSACSSANSASNSEFDVEDEDYPF